MVRSFTVIEDGSTSLSSLSDLMPVMPLSVKRRYVLVSLCSRRYGGLARYPRGCIAARSRSTLRRDGLRATERQLGDCLSTALFYCDAKEQTRNDRAGCLSPQRACRGFVELRADAEKQFGATLTISRFCCGVAVGHCRGTAGREDLARNGGGVVRPQSLARSRQPGGRAISGGHISRV